MRPKWLTLYCLVQKPCNLLLQIFGVCFASDITTAGDCDYVLEIGHIPVLHFSVDFIFLSFGIMDSILEL